MALEYVNRSEIKRYLVDCMKEILQRIHIYDLKKFLELYTLLFFQIYDRKKSYLGEFLLRDYKMAQF
jgi:hypothetical protein